MKIKKTTHLLLLGILFILTSCDGGEKTNEASEKEISLDDAKSMTFEEALAITWGLERKPVTIEGYFQLPYSASISKSGQSSSFFERRNQTNGEFIRLKIPLGNDKNQMTQLKNGFTTKDFMAKDDKGSAVGVNERVKITGLMYSVKSDPGEPHTVYMNVKKIEKIDEVEADYESLDFPTLSKKEYNKKYENSGMPFTLEGQLDVPRIALGGNQMTINLIDDSGNKYTLQMITGKGNSQMESLPPNWTENDIKIRDYQGNLLPVGTKVRVFGVLASDGLNVEYVKQI